MMRPIIVLLTNFLTVSSVFAATTFKGLMEKISTQIFNPLIAILIGAALIVFLWGLVEFIAKSGSEEARSTGKQHIIWGLIGLTIMIAVWGIVQILENFLCGPGGCPKNL